MKALVLVDDDPDQVELMLLAIKALDLKCSVVAFGSGAACIAALERGVVAPGLIVLDVSMPGLDGPDTASRIRAIAGHGSVPIVMLSTSNLPSDRGRARAARADGYVLKPTFDRSWVDAFTDIMEYWVDA
jgi:CheY-like chemotaxis protein